MARPTAFSTLELELRKAMAESLGMAGERLQRAIQRYTVAKSEFESARTTDTCAQLETARKEMHQAREWLIIQREAIGLRRHDHVDEQFPLAAEVRELA